MKCGAQKRKQKAQQQHQTSAAKSRMLKECFAAPITPTNNLTGTCQSTTTNVDLNNNQVDVAECLEPQAERHQKCWRITSSRFNQGQVSVSC